jgi:hypothetical protein
MCGVSRNRCGIILAPDEMVFARKPLDQKYWLQKAASCVFILDGAAYR